ncbi:MAG: alpha/beta fold hydrolase [Acidimicrobiia bacterium]
MRKLIVPMAALGALALATPRLLKRAFAPPVREIQGEPDDYGLAGADIWIDGPNGKRLHAWWIPVEGSAPAVIVLHGWGGNSADMLPIGPGLVASGFHVLFLDARKHGLSDDEDFMSMPRFAEDLTTAIEMVNGREDVNGIAVIGHSVGAAATIYAASTDRRIDAVVAVAPFAHPAEMMRQNFRFPAPVTWVLLEVVERMIGHDYDDIAPRNRIADITAPVMLMHGDADAVIPIGDSIDLHRRLPESELVVVPNGTHADLDPFRQFFPAVDTFLREHLHPSRPSHPEVRS